MKKTVLLLLLVHQFLFAQNYVSTPPITTNPANWYKAFGDDFNSGTTLPSWVLRNGHTRWLQEQVFQADQVEKKDGSLVLKITSCPSGIPNPLWYNINYPNANGFTAKYKSGEVYSKQKFLYGYIEAKIKLPSGKGAFPAFWLWPLYREHETATGGASDYNSIVMKYGYPEEIDIIEQRSVYEEDPDNSGAFFISHVYDFYTYWNNGQAYDNHMTSNYWESIVYDKQGNCNTKYAGDWHVFAVKWDLFGQHLFIDGERVFSNNLWSRRTSTESMSVVFSNQVLTDTSNSEQNPPTNTYDATSFGGHLVEECGITPNPTVKDVAFQDSNIGDEKFRVDWVKVWQEKKFENPIVWASRKSDKLGKFALEVASSPDVLISGNFVNVGDGDEILTFSTDGLRSALQKLTDKKMMFSHNVDTHVTTPVAYAEYDVWDVATIKEERRASASDGSFTLNNWFSPLTTASKYVAGNFDPVDSRDELFLSNNSTKWSMLLQFSDSQNNANDNPNNPPAYNNNQYTTVPYTFSELYANGGPAPNPNAGKITSCVGSTTLSYTTESSDILLSGNLDGSANNSDELFIINPILSKYAVLTKPSSANSCSTYWTNLLNAPSNTFTLVASGQSGVTVPAPYSWTMSTAGNDQYIIADFYKGNGDLGEELLCINKSSKLVCLYDFRYIGSTWQWVKLWGNDTSNPKAIALFNLGSGDSFAAGSFMNNGNTQLMCISANQQYCHIYEFNITGSVASWVSKQLNEQVNQQMDPTNPNTINKAEYLTYKYQSGNPAVIKTTLLTSEKYKNPYNLTCTGDTAIAFCNLTDKKKSNCVKYSINLTDFSVTGISPLNRMAAESNTLPEIKTLEQDSGLKLGIYPNPSKGHFKIALEATLSGSYQVFNELGVVVKEDQFENKNGIEVNLAGKAKGIYFIKVSSGPGVRTEKLVLN